MTEQEAAAQGRACPTCGRRVPGTVSKCRCGRELGLAETPSASVRTHDYMRMAKAIVVVLLAGSVMVAYWVSSTRSGPAPAARRVDASSTTPRPAVPVPPTTSNGAAPPTPAVTDAAPGDASSDPAARVAAAFAAAKARAAAEQAAGAAINTAVNTAAPPESSLEDVISRSLPAVVRIETSGALGTGFFIAADTILTNAHVVGGNASVTVRRADGTTMSGRVDTTATELDIAIVRVSGPNGSQPTLAMGSAAQARAGLEVIALGSPLGLQNTVTRGIVSAVREVGGLTLVQTDAAINPGNSGGPLMDRAGRVIGITTMGMRSDVAQGLSFAVAIEHAQSLLGGKRSSGATGTPLTTLTQAMTNGAASSAAEEARDRASKAYEHTIAMEAQRAALLDDRWSSFVRNCYQGRIVGSFDHPWFALWDAKALQGVVSPGCTNAFADIRRAAEDIHTRLVAADETARQGDVYPGTRRDVLRRYRLDYTGWAR
jgi:hypothetical protein